MNIKNINLILENDFKYSTIRYSDNNAEELVLYSLRYSETIDKHFKENVIKLLHILINDFPEYLI